MAICQQSYPQTTLGGGPDTIAQAGCYLCTWAQIRSWAVGPTNPVDLNGTLMQDGIFEPCFGGDDCLPDDALARAFPTEWRVEEVFPCPNSPCPQDKLDNDDPNLYVAVELSGGLLGSGTHFSPVYAWKDWTIEDMWTGTVRPISVWGGNPATLITKVIRVRYIGGAAPAPPAPAPTPTSFSGTVGPQGAHVRTLPGQDQAIVPQPGPGDPSIVNPGIALTFDAWCEHPPTGRTSQWGTDTMPMDQWKGTPDDRWFRTTSGHWIASACILGSPPGGMAAIADPSPTLAPSPPPAPQPVGLPLMQSYRDPAATWVGPVPNVTADRREFATPGDESTPNTGPSYNLAAGEAYIVLHHMDGTWQAANTRFHDAQQQASAHYGVRQDGSVLQWVDEKDASWNAGVWEINRRCIGIEHEDLAKDTYTASQLEASAQLVGALCKRYGIPAQHGSTSTKTSGIVGHKEVPYATACPGALPVDQIISRAAVILAGSPTPPPPPPPPPVPSPPPRSGTTPPPTPPPGALAWLEALLSWLKKLFTGR